MTLKCECCGSRKGLTRELDTANVYCHVCARTTDRVCDTCGTRKRGAMQQIMPLNTSYKTGRAYNNKRKW